MNLKQIIFSLWAIPSSLALVTSKASAQVSGVELSGRVRDAAGQPVGFATVALLKAEDSSLVKGAITTEAGTYQFTVSQPGVFRVMASQTGMQRVYSAAFSLSGTSGKKGLGDLVLHPDTHLLGEVKVTATKPLIQFEADKTVVNVENSAMSAGSNAWEVLEKSPGVTVDNSTNTIRLQGKTGVEIYLDGKPTYLSRDQLADMLKNMDASNIKSLEIMTQPPAKYDAAGNAGIINIVTRKSEKKGLNGSVTAGFGQGRYAKENVGGMINYRSGKFNLYGNYAYNHAIWWNSNDIDRNFHDGPQKSVTTRTEQYGSQVSPSQSHSFKTGMDYSIDEQNTLGVMMTGSINPGSGRRENTSRFLDGEGNLETTSVSHNNDTRRWTNYTYDLNYRGVYDSTGRELDVDAAYSKFDKKMLQHFRTDAYDAQGELVADEPGQPNPNIRKGNIPSTIEITTAKIDYTLPFDKDTKLEMGAKYSMVISDNDVSYRKLDNPTGAWMYDSASNHFRYSENINAVYGSFKKKLKKGWSFQLGLRGEQTVSRGHQYTNDSTVRRNYFQLFPSLYLSKQLDKNNVLNFSASRRIDRPDYEDLNPFRYYLDPYTYEEGNPFLRPQLSETVKLTFAHASMFSAALSYGKVSDVMSQVLKQDDSLKITYQTEDNLSRLKNIGLNVNFSNPVTKWWTTNDFLNIFHNKYQGAYLGGNLDFGATAFTFQSTNTFPLPAHFTAELSGYYQSRMLWSIFSISPRYQISVGVRKTILQDKGTIKLNLSDVFNTMHGTASVKYQNLDLTSTNRWESRRISLSFSYRFSKGNVKELKHHESSIDEEQNRIKK